jgi:hypothetical protein
MENAVLMQMDEGLQNLVQKALRLLTRQRSLPLRSHVLFQIELKVLKNQIELLLTVNYLLKPKSKN